MHNLEKGTKRVPKEIAQRVMQGNTIKRGSGKDLEVSLGQLGQDQLAPREVCHSPTQSLIPLPKLFETTGLVDIHSGKLTSPAIVGPFHH